MDAVFLDIPPRVVARLLRVELNWRLAEHSLHLTSANFAIREDVDVVEVCYEDWRLISWLGLPY